MFPRCICVKRNACFCASSELCRSWLQVTESRDAEGLRIFYYLVQDLKTMAITIINAHFRINPLALQ